MLAPHYHYASKLHDAAAKNTHYERYAIKMIMETKPVKRNPAIINVVKIPSPR